MALTLYDVASADELTGSDGFLPKAGVDSNGRIFVVYTKDVGATNDVYLAYSSDSGQNWTEEQVATSDYKFASLFVDSSDNVHIAYSNNSLEATLRYRMRNADDSWEDAETITTTEDSYYTAIAVDSSGNIWVVAHNYNGSTYDLKVHKKVSGSWSLASTLTAAAGFEFFGHVMKIQNDILHVIMTKRETATPTESIIEYNSFDTSDSSWSGAVTICNGVSEAGKEKPFGLAVQSTGVVWAFWINDGYGTNSGVKQVIYNTNLGGSWVGATNLTDTAAAHADPVSTTMDNDSVVVAYSEYVGGTFYDCKYQTYQNSTWGSEIIIADDNYHQHMLGIANDGNDAIYYFPQNYQSGDSTWDLYSATDDGGVILSVDVTISTVPNISIAPNAVDEVVAFSDPDSLPEGYKQEFLLLDTADTGFGTPQLLINWSHIGIHCEVATTGSSIEIYVSNNGTDYVLRHTFSASGFLSIKSAYKWIKAKQVSGSAQVILIGNRDTMMY